MPTFHSTLLTMFLYFFFALLHSQSLILAAQEQLEKKKKAQLQLLESRKRREASQGLGLQVKSVPTLPAKRGPPSDSVLRATKKIKSSHGADKTIKKQASPKPTVAVPKSVSVTPDGSEKQPFDEDELTLSSTGSNPFPATEGNNYLAIFNEEEDSSTVIEDQKKAKMSEEMSTKTHISIVDADKVCDRALARQEKLNKIEISKRDGTIKQLETRCGELTAQLQLAQAGENFSMDPALKEELLKAQKSMATCLEAKAVVDKAYATLEAKDKKRKEDTKKTNKELKTLKKELETLKTAQPDAAAAQELKTTKKELTITKTALSKANRELETLKKAPKGKTSDENKALKEKLAKSLQDLKKCKEDLKKATEDVAKGKKAIQDLETKLEDAQGADGDDSSKATTAEYKALKKKHDQLVKQFSRTQKTNQSLVSKNQALEKQIQQYTTALKKSKKTCKAEQKSQILTPAKAYLKDVVFRTTKLCSSKVETEVNALAKKVYDGIKGDLGLGDKKGPDYLPLEEFQRIYSGELLKYFSTQRSNVQSACLKAVIGTS